LGAGRGWVPWRVVRAVVRLRARGAEDRRAQRARWPPHVPPHDSQTLVRRRKSAVGPRGPSGGESAAGGRHVGHAQKLPSKAVVTVRRQYAVVRTHDTGDRRHHSAQGPRPARGAARGTHSALARALKPRTVNAPTYRKLTVRGKDKEQEGVAVVYYCS
jgi:hypothetical protein